ncbi:izumo sperm-egg fusion protein 2 [Microcaecilia unicolor]|uniref:Izumo sperm-egg fusion protein 2 n=1 Tax=Microcaecilia unicolor TaxID=1415580 RepID=A0A6P7XE83_9AMPH|nr:izumo sperm-egg fusion protein 2 [Microcaecilia unicolor]
MPRAFGCVQCTKDASNGFSVLRQELVPRKIKDTALKGRAEQLLVGMEGPFFIDYAVTHFTGKMEIEDYNQLVEEIKHTTALMQNSHLTDQALLDALVEYRQNITLKMKTPLKDYHNKACSKEICRHLVRKVFDCTKCKMVKPKCLSKRHCFVDTQERITLRFNQKAEAANLARRGLITVSAMGIITFLVLLTMALTHKRNLKILGGTSQRGVTNTTEKKLDKLPQVCKERGKDTK